MGQQWKYRGWRKAERAWNIVFFAGLMISTMTNYVISYSLNTYNVVALVDDVE